MNREEMTQKLQTLALALRAQDLATQLQRSPLWSARGFRMSDRQILTTVNESMDALSVLLGCVPSKLKKIKLDLHTKINKESGKK